MHSFFVLLSFFTCLNYSGDQKTYGTSSGVIKFVSSRNSDVKAVNSLVNVSITEAGDFTIRLQIRDFRFEMGEMEEHFNREYLESHKYPGASFVGKIAGLQKIDLTKPGVHKVQAEGEMTIHNVAKKLVVPGTLQIERNFIHLRSRFIIDIEDYKIDTGLGGIIIGDRMEIEVIARCQYPINPR
ncbi:MAG TPA: YceI family protein [Chitinophagaceae bacterium]